MKVSEILGAKGHDVVTVSPETRVSSLVRRLHIEGIGAAVVSRDGETIDGLVSERDIVHALATQDTELLGRPVSEFMTREVVTCRPDDSMKSVMATMTRRRIRHLPVVEGGRLVGVVSIGDVVKNRLEEMELETRVLRDYAVAH